LSRRERRRPGRSRRRHPTRERCRAAIARRGAGCPTPECLLYSRPADGVCQLAR
jgi:hypothetical protein